MRALLKVLMLTCEQVTHNLLLSVFFTQHPADCDDELAKNTFATLKVFFILQQHFVQNLYLP